MSAARQRRSDLVRGADRDCLTPRADALDAGPDEHLAGADLVERVDAVRRTIPTSRASARVPVTCSTSAARISSGRSSAGRDIGDDRHRRRLTSTVASASPMASAAGCISAEWNGAETGSMIARLAPFSLHSSAACSTAAWSPEITNWPAHCRWRAWQTEPSRGLVGDGVAPPESRPMIAAMAPAPTGTACCMALPRDAQEPRGIGHENVPAAASAEYSPSEWPAT